VVFDAFEKQRRNKGMERSTCRYLFDGQRLLGNEKATGLDMEDGDTIDVVLTRVDAMPKLRPSPNVSPVETVIGNLALELYDRDRNTLHLIADLEAIGSSCAVPIPIPTKLAVEARLAVSYFDRLANLPSVTLRLRPDSPSAELHAFLSQTLKLKAHSPGMVVPAAAGQLLKVHPSLTSILARPAAAGATFYVGGGDGCTCQLYYAADGSPHNP
jgi:hypothetical protein